MNSSLARLAYLGMFGATLSLWCGFSFAQELLKAEGTGAFIVCATTVPELNLLLESPKVDLGHRTAMLLRSKPWGASSVTVDSMARKYCVTVNGTWLVELLTPEQLEESQNRLDRRHKKVWFID